MDFFHDDFFDRVYSSLSFGRSFNSQHDAVYCTFVTVRAPLKTDGLLEEEALCCSQCGKLVQNQEEDQA
jgi:hypothetical protein